MSTEIPLTLAQVKAAVSDKLDVACGQRQHYCERLAGRCNPLAANPANADMELKYIQDRVGRLTELQARIEALQEVEALLNRVLQPNWLLTLASDID